MSVAVVLAFCVLVAVGVVGRRFQRPRPRRGLVAVVHCVDSGIYRVGGRAQDGHKLSAFGGVALSFLSGRVLVPYHRKGVRPYRMADDLGGSSGCNVERVYGFYFGAGSSQHATRATLAAGGGHVNPNRFGSCLLLPLAFALARVLTVRNRLAKILALSLLGITSLGLLLTMSRGITIAAIVTVLVFFYRLKYPPESP